MDRRVRLPLYVLVILIISSTAGPALSVWLSVRIANKATTEQIAVTRAERCEEYAGLIGTLEPAEPRLTEAGRRLLALYRQQYADTGCQPPR